MSLVSSSQVPGFTDSDVDDDAKFEAKPSETMKGSGFKLVVRNIPLDWSGQQLDQYIYNLDNDIEINHIGVTRQRAAIFVNRAKDARRVHELLHHRLVSGYLLRVLLLCEVDFAENENESEEEDRNGVIDVPGVHEESEEEIPSASISDCADGPLGTGDAVFLHGSTKNTALNGEVGVISGVDETTGRYCVQLGDRAVRVNAVNIERYSTYTPT